MITLVWILQVALLAASVYGAHRGSHALVVSFGLTVAIVGLVGGFVLWPEVSTVSATIMVGLIIPGILVASTAIVDRVIHGGALATTSR